MISVVQKGYRLGGRVLRPAMVVVGGKQTEEEARRRCRCSAAASSPKLDGLSREEEKRRDSLNAEVHAPAGEGQE